MPRKRPFSAKQKRLQLRDRRQRKRGDASPGSDPAPRSRSVSAERNNDAEPSSGDGGEKGRKRDTGRFRLQLAVPHTEALSRSRRRAQEELLQPLPSAAMELHPDTVYGDGMDFPRRPPWSYGMSREELRAREEESFNAFLRGLRGDGGSNQDLAPFEHTIT
ncbi:guanine nucleotide-binding protein-like 1 [Coturnix japonica]|uniref:guanine nucleotide-binding protein-like 1 n=1 Tax=Coturnix japonica TaxID=93934 RepID=UPI0007770310|nr:guanine nucleotide-binding protein-like 1 [Coturnix japonica]